MEESGVYELEFAIEVSESERHYAKHQTRSHRCHATIKLSVVVIRVGDPTFRSILKLKFDVNH